MSARAGTPGARGYPGGQRGTAVLSLEGVTRRPPGGGPGRALLNGVSLQLHTGELVAVWGVRDSGRSTLLRIAAGIQPPDGGVVRFAGEPLRGHGELLGRGIGYCPCGTRSLEASAVLDELLVCQLAHGVSRRAARRQALAALERAGAAGCAARECSELDGAEAVRASIARALVLAPRLLVIDEPTAGVDLLARDAILALLRSLADDGLALLVSAGEATALSGADRALALTEGVLRGSAVPELAPVLPLRRHASA